MKISKKLLMAVTAICMTSCAVMAEDSVQAYAHPTLFGTQGHSLINAQNDVVVGGKICTPANVKTIQGKENVIVARSAKKMLFDMKAKMDQKRGSLYDPKMPVLRSELAFFISEGLGLTKVATDSYSDVASDYWAKTEIDRVLTQDIMIGYPDSTFKPDKVINKAEVFCTFAKLMNVEASKTDVPTFNGKTMQYIPEWAYGATNEVIASGILASLPNQDKVVNDEYLSKEQVAFLVSAMRRSFRIDLENGAIGCATKCEPVAIKIKLSERLSARTSTAGDTFTAKTTEDVTVAGVAFPTGSTVSGKVVSVSRPGVKNPGFIEVQFEKIKNGDNCVEFPAKMAGAQTDVTKNPNIASRILGAPFSIVGRVAGVAGRSVSETANIISNGTEEYLGNWSDAFVDTASLHPLKGAKSVGSSFITAGKGVYNIAKTAVSGSFGVVYEIVDEFKYIIVPNTTNDSCLNPDEELTIMF
ncbi:MAG: S-layer homology domain-containing protein [bacterium]|nr:S-layer homology domain-containing protein [bacterium]